MIQALQSGFFRYPLGSFVILHGLGGRTASIIAARLAGFEMALYLPLAILLDMIQVPLLFFLYEETGERISWLKKLRERAERQKERLADSRLYKKLVLLGQVGVVLMTLLPIKGGGMWSGALLAHLIQVRRSRSYLLLFVGSLLGGLLLVGLSDLIREAWIWLRQD
ncbi:MAG: small multi-drug export protein [candidate division NC10 bacterium]|nr:small multi-drug export protein [candidate division NC10 bacterium]